MLKTERRRTRLGPVGQSRGEMLRFSAESVPVGVKAGIGHKKQHLGRGVEVIGLDCWFKCG